MGTVPTQDILRHPDSALSIVKEVSQEYFQCLAQYAGQHIGKALVRSGMVSVQDTKALSRLIRAACIGAHVGTLNELEDIQKDGDPGVLVSLHRHLLPWFCLLWIMVH